MTNQRPHAPRDRLRAVDRFVASRYDGRNVDAASAALALELATVTEAVGAPR